MRVTGPLIKVLRVMLDVARVGEEVYGLEICRRTGLKSGTLYPLLDRLEGAGWVEARWEDIDPTRVGRPRRRLYRLTGQGAHEAEFVLKDHGVAGALRWA